MTETNKRQQEEELTSIRKILLHLLRKEHNLRIDLDELETLVYHYSELERGLINKLGEKSA